MVVVVVVVLGVTRCMNRKDIGQSAAQQQRKNRPTEADATF